MEDEVTSQSQKTESKNKVAKDEIIYVHIPASNQ